MTEKGVPANLNELVITHAQVEKQDLEKLCFGIGNKVYEHFKTPGDTWKYKLNEILLKLKNTYKESIDEDIPSGKKEHLKAMILDFELLEAPLTKYEKPPEQLLTRANTYKEISLEYCEQLLKKCTSNEQATKVNALKTKIPNQSNKENE